MPTDQAMFEMFVDKLAEALVRHTQSKGPARTTVAVFEDEGADSLRGGKRKKHAKRSSLRIARTTTALLAHIKANKGHRIEEIAAALHIPTADLKYPAQKLLSDGKVKTKGAKRGTTYFIA